MYSNCTAPYGEPKFVRRRTGLVRAAWEDVRFLFKTAREQPVRGPGVWCEWGISKDVLQRCLKKKQLTNHQYICRERKYISLPLTLPRNEYWMKQIPHQNINTHTHRHHQHHHTKGQHICVNELGQHWFKYGLGAEPMLTCWLLVLEIH